MKLPIEKIKCDIKGRTNHDLLELYKSLISHGQLDPLLVEGPDEEGNYFLIHGYLRYMSMLSDRKRFKDINCAIIRGITSTEERNALRLVMISNSKKPTGLDQQLVYEELEDFKDREGLVPKKKQSRIKKGKDVPQEIRLEYEKKRRSQDALAFIYGLEGLGEYSTKLLNLLKDGNITTIHGDAIKRITKHPLYQQLSQNQKVNAIEKARKVVKFTDNQAGFIILEQIMKQYPQKNNINGWVEYICDEIEKVSELIHAELREMTTDLHKRKLQKSMIRLESRLDWIQKQDSYKDKKASPKEPARTKSVIREEKIIKKQVIIMEKRDGIKMTFYFN